MCLLVVIRNQSLCFLDVLIAARVSLLLDFLSGHSR